MTPRSDWWNDHGNLIYLAHCLIREGLLSQPEEVVLYFDEPWKWTSEWEYFLSQAFHAEGRN